MLTLLTERIEAHKIFVREAERGEALGFFSWLESSSQPLFDIRPPM